MRRCRGRAGTDHDRNVGLPEASYGLGEEADRRRRQHGVGDVVRTDQDDRHVGIGEQRLGDLLAQIARLGADCGELAQVHPSVGALGDAGAKPGSRGLLDAVDAVAGRARVAQQGDLDRRRGSTPPVPPGRVRHAAPVGRADRPARELCLGSEYAVEGRAQHREAAAPVSGSGGEFACCRCSTHEVILRACRDTSSAGVPGR